MNQKCIVHNEGSFEAALAKTHQVIEEHQTSNIVVHGSGNHVGFGYSLGLLKNFNHPEIIILGLPEKSCHLLLNTFRDELADGKSFEPNKVYTNFTEKGFPLMFKTVAKEFYSEYFGYGLKYYKTFAPESLEQFSALQMVWSDINAKFPWEAGYFYQPFQQPLLFHQIGKRGY